MHALIEHMLAVFLGFFAIMNPIANTAVFIGLTAQESRAARSRIALRALLISFGIVVVFALLGKTIFHLFGITLPALRITGGLLVAQVGYHMLQGKESHVQSNSGAGDVDIAISPLAMPILAGPGTIATAMNYSASHGSGEVIITISMFALLCVVTYVFFQFCDQIVKLFGKRGLKIVTRMMGLILAVIGVQMLLSGIFGAIEANQAVLAEPPPVAAIES